MNHFTSLKRDVSSAEKRRVMTTSLYLDSTVYDDEDEDDYVQVISAPIARHTASNFVTEKHPTAIQPPISSIDTNDLVCKMFPVRG